MPSKLAKRVDLSWDFRGDNTKELTHCFHRYPAQMIPQIARRLIQDYGKKGKLLFDPYCGSGTSLVEALIWGMDCAGCDINPLALLMSEAKTAKVSPAKLEKSIVEIETKFLPFGVEETEAKTKPAIPKVTNLDFWFPQNSIRKLGILKSVVDKVEDNKIRRFFIVAFSETVREASYTRSGEFKLFRIPKEKLEKFQPDVYGLFLKKIRRNLSGYRDFAQVREDNECRVYNCNTTKKLPPRVKGIQLVVTSPPYGDSRTTVAYGQYSTLPLEWLGFHLARKIDGDAMGGKRNGNGHSVKSKTLLEIIAELTKRDPKRTEDVVSFYVDLEKSIRNVSKVVAKNGFACYVVGNRTVKSLNLPTDEIVTEMFQEHGFSHCETIIRNIPNKAMPLKNSPTNVAGDLVETMTKEFIVIMQKRKLNS